MPVYRKMTLRERMFGREPDTSEVVVYKNYTVGEWFFGKTKDRSMRLITAFQRTVGILCGVAALAMLTCKLLQ